MKRKRIDVPLYDFRIDLLEVDSVDDVELVGKALRTVRVQPDIYDEITSAIRDGDVDGGWTISNFGLKRILVVLLKMRSGEQRRKVLSHEKRHIEDDILSYCSVDDVEASAYLAGYLGKFIY